MRQDIVICAAPNSETSDVKSAGQMKDGKMQMNRVYAWPTVQHICVTGIRNIYFSGACRDGATVTCPHCHAIFVYVKDIPIRREPIREP